ncbi:MAG: hypothetical protein JWP16_1789 [Alphaproteobacteria bacterium]|nr:hypothetical protein [Alphaproteobacteria bacterium]MDB5740749.1 hypothetical protein [Alphaproteobacteria bacterium]
MAGRHALALSFLSIRLGPRSSGARRKFLPGGHAQQYAPSSAKTEDSRNVRSPLILLLLLPLLGGCFPAQKQDLAQCVAEATKATPVDGLSDPDERHDAIGETVVDCMRRGGYQHSLGDPKCIDDVDFDVHCYMPTGFWRKAVYSFEAKD